MVWGSAAAGAVVLCGLGWCLLQQHRRRYRALRRDPVTGLPVRLEWERQLRRREVDPDHVVGVVDFDGLKEITETYRRAVGDEVMTVLARRVERALLDSIVCRDGDLLLFATPRPHDWHHLLERLEEPVDTSLALVQVTATLGVARLGSFPVSALAVPAAERAVWLARAHGLRLWCLR